MTWSISRPRNLEAIDRSVPGDGVGSLLGVAAAATIVLGILSSLAALDVEPFGGSVPVLVGLLGGAGLVVAGAVGLARSGAVGPR